MVIDRLRKLVDKDFGAVNDLMIEKTHSDVDLINDLSNHLVQSGGKRLRPLLVLLSSHACNYQGNEHITLATMVEFFHTATLLHDDVIDESTLRRGRETANKIWGSKASILVGDYLFVQYMLLMVDVGNLKIMRLLADIAHQITSGEVNQYNNRHKYTLTVDEYFDVIRSKTSLLFAASATLGALISHSSEAVEKGLYAYGLHVGNAFQLIDDALDYCSNAKTLGKNIGDDLADGKLTLPLLHALKYGSSEQQSIIKTSLEKGTLDYLPQILESIVDTDAIEYTRGIAAIEVDRAITALQVLPDSKYKSALADLAQYAIQRDH